MEVDPEITEWMLTLKKKNYLKSTVVTVLKEIKNDVHQVIKNRKPLHRKRLSFFKKRHMKLQN